MNTLVLRPGREHLAFRYFLRGRSQPACSGHLDDYRGLEGSRAALAELTKLLDESGGPGQAPSQPDVVVLRGIYGGAEFKTPVLASPKVLRRLERLIPHAPLHLPALLGLLESCQAAWQQTPIVLVFETAFFVDLPEREHLYAVDQNLAGMSGVRRFGYHGILHAAACRQVARARRQQGLKTGARVLSICLEARPELAAVLGHKPLLVTSGATPLEGLPGQTTCGELDPSIVLMLAQKKGWGPEQINTVLTRESGWLGLVGRLTTLAEIFESRRPECQLARNLIRYRLLQACGAGAAALGGVDAIVFSGRCSAVGVSLGLWLKKKLEAALPGAPRPIDLLLCQESVDHVLAETACAAALDARLPRP